MTDLWNLHNALKQKQLPFEEIYLARDFFALKFYNTDEFWKCGAVLMDLFLHIEIKYLVYRSISCKL